MLVNLKVGKGMIRGGGLHSIGNRIPLSTEYGPLWMEREWVIPVLLYAAYAIVEHWGRTLLVVAT